MYRGAPSPAAGCSGSGSGSICSSAAADCSLPSSVGHRAQRMRCASAIHAMVPSAVHEQGGGALLEETCLRGRRGELQRHSSAALGGSATRCCIRSNQAPACHTACIKLAKWQVYWQLRLHRERTPISGCRCACIIGIPFTKNRTMGHQRVLRSSSLVKTSCSRRFRLQLSSTASAPTPNQIFSSAPL